MLLSKTELRTQGQSVSFDNPWFAVETVAASNGSDPSVPSTSQGPVLQPGLMLGLSLGFGTELLMEDNCRKVHVSGDDIGERSQVLGGQKAVFVT